MSERKSPEDLMQSLNPPKKVGVFAWLRGRFFAGMVIAAPLAITFWILQFVITEIDKSVKPLLPPLLKPETYTNYAIPGFGVLVLVIALTLLGAVTANLIGRSLLSATDRVLSRVPIVRNLYAAFKQLTEVLSNNQQASFDRCVMVEYPRTGSWCIGFVASNAKGEIGAVIGTEKIGVFVPTTPNPTSGFLIYVDPSECHALDMSIEEGAKMILTAGLVVPDFTPKPAAGVLPASVAEGEIRTEKLTEQA